MPKLGGELIDLYFRQHYKRGAILRFYMECDDPEVDFKYKFGILLNLNTTESDALLGITTSNLKPFASGFLENDIVRISGGKYPCSLISVKFASSPSPNCVPSANRSR